MPVHFPWSVPLSDEHPVIEHLHAANARDVRLPWFSHFSANTLTSHLTAHPGMALWVPKTGEYAVAEPWRRRSEIAQLVEVTARKGKPALLTALLDRLREMDYRLVVISDESWHDDARLYSSLGFAHLEKVVYFQKDLRGRWEETLPSGLPDLQFSLLSLRELDVLLEVDHASFPWLWWNSRDELEMYVQMGGVYVYGAFVGGEPIGYASFTLYNGWAHLDRLAVVVQHHGKGYGASQLAHVLRAMSLLKASSATLSTQQNNVKSQKLYQRFGFKLAPDMINLYGLELVRRET
ncbi:MAG TPA: GNAT family N-acetyltransferase [Chloroflexia bacterium]|nr:GNAT family N-acetyltransferase [Chloroflexia bacterium]